MDVARKLARNFVALLAGNILGQVFNLLALLHLAQVLTPSTFGVWNFANVWMVYMLRAGEFGLEVVGLRHAARNPGETSWWTASIILVRIVLAVGLFGVTFLLDLFGLFPAEAATLVALLALTLFPMALTTEWVFEARQEVSAISIGRIAKGLIFLVLVVLVVRGVDDSEKAALSYVLSVAIPTVALLTLTARRFGFSAKGFTVRTALRILGDSSPIGIASILTNYNFFAGTLIAGYLVTGSELGYFTAAHRLVVFVWAYVIVTFHHVLIPTLTRYFHESMETFVRFVKRFFTLAVIAAAPCGMLGTLASDRMVNLLYPDEYASAAPVLALLLWSLFMALSRTIFEIALIASNRQRRYSYGVVFVSVAYTVLTPLLILQMGIVGAALASLVVETGYFVGLLVSFPYAGASTFGRDLWKPMIAAAAGIVPALMLPPDQRFWFFPIGLVLYVSVLALSKSVSAQDYQMVRSVFWKKAAKA